MQIHLPLLAALFAGVANCLPATPARDAFAVSNSVERSEEAGWLLYELPSDGVVEKRHGSELAKRDSESGIAPKVFIVSMFTPEETVWFGIPEFDILAHNVTLPGLSPLFPDVHCTSDYNICQVVTGEGEINAATTISALSLSPVFDLRQTYFLVAGIGGVDPKMGTLGTVTLHRYEVQVALEYEFDPRDLPANFSTGYIAQGALLPGQYPGELYGTEVFELNSALRDEAISMISAANVTLNDTAKAAEYRALYASQPGDAYAAATKVPSVVACDGATSDVYFSGPILGETFENFTRLMTNGSGTYCTTAQEDNATLEALLRSSSANKTDFSRIMVMRTASDFDRPPPGISAYDNLLVEDQDANPSFQNIVIAGVPIIQGIISGWDTKFAAGINATNYAGDIFGTLGGKIKMDIGTPSADSGNAPTKRAIRSGKMKNKKRAAHA